jgi:hypothetical protein
VTLEVSDSKVNSGRTKSSNDNLKSVVKGGTGDSTSSSSSFSSFSSSSGVIGLGRASDCASTSFSEALS